MRRPTACSSLHSKAPSLPHLSPSPSPHYHLCNPIHKQLNAMRARNTITIFPRRKERDANNWPVYHTGQDPVSISRTAVEALFDKRLSEAAERLGISNSTLKSVCRQLGILQWPYKRQKKSPKSPPNHPPGITIFEEGRGERSAMEQHSSWDNYHSEGKDSEFSHMAPDEDGCDLNWLVSSFSPDQALASCDNHLVEYS